MSKVQPLIIVDLRLKKRIMDFVIKELVEELNIDKELDKYKKLKYQEKKVFLKIKRLLDK